MNRVQGFLSIIFRALTSIKSMPLNIKGAVCPREEMRAKNGNDRDCHLEHADSEIQ